MRPGQSTGARAAFRVVGDPQVDGALGSCWNAGSLPQLPELVEIPPIRCAPAQFPKADQTPPAAALAGFRQGDHSGGRCLLFWIVWRDRPETDCSRGLMGEGDRWD